MLLHSDRPTRTATRRSTTSFSVILVTLAVVVGLPVALLMLGEPRPTTGDDPVFLPQPPAYAVPDVAGIPDDADVLSSQVLSEMRDARTQPPADIRDAEGRSLIDLGRSTMDAPARPDAAEIRALLR